MGKIKINKRLFHSKELIFSLIFSFILLIATEATPNKVDSDSNKEFKPVVRVKETQERIPASQKERFERLIEEGKRLLLEEMDYEGAIIKFNEAKNLAISREQKADTLFYLSLVFFASSRETRIEDCDETIRKLIKIDYHRELDSSLCPPRYMELFRGIKKEYGVLVVQSKPAGADVYINDSKDPVGITPLTIGSKAGSIKIRVKKGKKEKKEILKVIAGEKTASPIYILKGGSSLLLVLGGIVLAGGVGAAFFLKGKPGEEGGAPTTGIIQVNSSPTGSSVYLDGTDTGKTTNCTLTFVSPGSHTVKLIKEGYEDYEESVSVTAGQTTTVNANLTTHTITVTSPTSGTIWTQGDEVEIRWETSGSANSQGNVGTSTGLSPLSYPGRNLSPSSQRRAFRHNPAFRDLIRTRRGLESSNLSKNEGTILNKSSKFQDVSKKLSSSGKNGNIFGQREKNIGVIEKNKGFSNTNLPFSPGTSFISSRHLPQALEPSGNIKALTLTDVKIELYKGTSLVQTIAPSTENDGTYTWTEVASSLEDGSDYKVRVSCISESEVYGESDEFTIEERSITVIEPISSTIWVTGDSSSINWTFSGAISNVKIDLYKGITYLTIVSSTENDGSYTWTEVDPSLANGTDYKVRISDVSESGVYGESDEFEITHGYKLITKWGSEGSGDGQFNKLEGIAADEAGNVYVADRFNNCIQKFTSDGTFVTKWGSHGSGDGQFDYLQGIAVDGSGYVYVVEVGNARIQKFTSNGGFVTKWGTWGSGDGEFDGPNGIAVDSSGYVYVTEHHNKRIQKFTSSGSFVTKWGSYGSGDGQFNDPIRIAVDSSGYVYVADSGNHRIQKFTSDGTFVTKWGSQGTGDGQFNDPIGIAVDSSGYVYVADSGNHRIQKFTSDGTFVTKWGSQGTGDGQFWNPDGIAVDSSGYVYVADAENLRIQKFGPISAIQKAAKLTYSPLNKRFTNRKLRPRPGFLNLPELDRLEKKQELMNKKVIWKKRKDGK